MFNQKKKDRALRVVLIYRKPNAGGYSIEQLFHAIACELRKQIEVVEYAVGDRRSFLLDAWRLRQLDADIYHITGDINYMVNLLPRKKVVLTVHDIGNYLFGLSGIKRSLYKWFWLIFPIRRAGLVTSVSMETRNNIVKHLRITNKRIVVIENCHSAIFKPVEKSFAKECPVILQVGAWSYKNVPRLVESLKGLRCHLVLIGRLDDEIMQKLAECEVSYENLVGLTQNEIYQKYVECDVVSFVSLGEGFGVPIIEAQAVGRPLITADVSPLCDVAGKGACLVNPLDVSQIREGIQRIIGDENYRNKIIATGFQNVSRYSPATISGQYLALYKKLIC
jgi:glycosyltransferase involved in cell wall biosynthesis